MNAKSKPTLSILMLLVGSLLVGFSMGRWQAPLAAWIGPALILRYARDHKVLRGYVLVLVASILSTGIGFISIWLGGLPLPLIPFLLIGIGFLWSLPYLADRMVASGLKGFSSTFVYPLAATTVEFLFIHFNPLGAWGATGFTQYGNLPLMQLASVTGMIGITFLMGWFASTTNWSWENRDNLVRTFAGLGTFGVVITVVLAFGSLRLNRAIVNRADETIRIAGITASPLDSLGELKQETPDAAKSQILAHWNAYFAATVREAQAGAKVILWPEVAGVTSENYGTGENLLTSRAREIARQYEIYLGLPIYVEALEATLPYENKLLLIDPAGEIVIEHFKYGGAITEGYRVQGDGKLQTVATSFGILSGVICYDMDYPAVIQQSGRNGTGLMLAPSRDWFSIDPVHTHMAVFRAVENGMSVVRQVDRGLSIAVDPYGRVLAQTDFYGTTDRTMVAQVPVRNVTTVYSLFGRWFEWLAPIGFLFFVGMAFFTRRQG